MRALVTALAVLILSACGQGQPAPEGGALVTVFGEVSETDRGASVSATEPLFAAYDISFRDARAFTLADLQSLPAHSVEVRFPLGGDEHEFRGPLLRDVLGAASASGSRVTITALDGYRRTIPAARLADHDVILALSMDGEALGIGGYGPAMIVWPRDSDTALRGQDDSDWVWGVFAIRSHNGQGR